jgi:hypothetical protein
MIPGETSGDADLDQLGPESGLEDHEDPAVALDELDRHRRLQATAAGEAVATHRARLRLSGSRSRFHRRTSRPSQTGVARRRSTGSGKSSRCVHRIACRRDVRSISATSASPTRSGSAIPSMMMTHVSGAAPRERPAPGAKEVSLDPPAA